MAEYSGELRASAWALPGAAGSAGGLLGRAEPAVGAPGGPCLIHPAPGGLCPAVGPLGHEPPACPCAWACLHSLGTQKWGDSCLRAASLALPAPPRMAVPLGICLPTPLGTIPALLLDPAQATITEGLQGPPAGTVRPSLQPQVEPAARPGERCSPQHCQPVATHPGNLPPLPASSRAYLGRRSCGAGASKVPGLDCYLAARSVASRAARWGPLQSHSSRRA